MEREKLVKTVTLAQGGDSEALNELFNAFYNDVYYFALKNVKDEDLACDITQEAFVEIINTLGNLKEPAAFVTWMKQITYHQCTRYFKKKKDVLMDENEDGDTIFDTMAEERTEFIPDEAVDEADFRATIMAMIDQLPDEQRAATMMYYFDEMSVKEIAQAQGVGENTVKGRLSYSRKAIKKSVEDYEKKNNVKLHCVGLLPLLLWLFRNYGKAMPIDSAKAVAEGVSTATGVGICVAAGSGAVTTAVTTTAAVGLGAKLAAIPLFVKITAAVVAVAVAISAVAIGMNKNDDAASTPTTLQEETSTSTENGSSSPSTKPEKPTAPTEQVTLDIPPKEEKPDLPPVEAPPLQEDDATDAPSEDEQTSQYFRVPAGCTYTAVTGEVFEAGELVTVSCSAGDLFTDGEYNYTYDSYYIDDNSFVELSAQGWCVQVIDRGKTSYAPIASEVNGHSVVSLRRTFENCTALKTAPIIPDGVTSLEGTFLECSSLQSVPNLPEAVTNMDGTFSGCSAIQAVPAIPNGVTSLNATFQGCSSLQGVPNLPEAVTNMDFTFSGCSAIQTVPAIPNGVKSLLATFQHCGALQGVPNLPEAVTNMASTFLECGALQTVPDIPKGVRTMDHTFQGCSSLLTAPALPDGITILEDTFLFCSSLRQAPVIPESVTDLIGTFFGCTSLQAAPEIPDAVTNMRDAFRGCSNLSQASEFPPNVINISKAYSSTAITIAPTIPNTVVYASGAFSFTKIKTAPVIPENVICASNIFWMCYDLRGEVVINANLQATHDDSQCPYYEKTCAELYLSLFDDCRYDIILSGTSSQLEEIAALYDNVSVK